MAQLITCVKTILPVLKGKKERAAIYYERWWVMLGEQRLR